MTAGHDAVSPSSSHANPAASKGLRKNLKTWNPSIGASFQAPPKALYQPPNAPTVSAVTNRGSGAKVC